MKGVLIQSYSRKLILPFLYKSGSSNCEADEAGVPWLVSSIDLQLRTLYVFLRHAGITGHINVY